MFKGSNSNKIQHIYDQIFTLSVPVHHSNRKAFKINHSLIQNTSKHQIDSAKHQPTMGKSQSHRVELQRIKKAKESVDLSRRGLDSTAQKIYHNKKNAYKSYIRDIYIKINQQLRKKNTFLTIAPQSIRQVDYSNTIITKEVKPLQIVEEKEKTLRKKVKEVLKLQNIQLQTIVMDNMKQQMKSTIKIQQDSKQFATFLPKRQKLPASNTEREVFKIKKTKKQIFEEQKTDLSTLSPTQKRRERIYSLNATINLQNKIIIEDFIPASKAFSKKEPFVCGMAEKMSIQEKNKEKILFYVDFIWKINYANGLFVKSTPEDTIYKAYVGPGNNSNMVKSILKRRFWWNIVQKYEDCNFVWTQLKINSIFKQFQSPSQTSLDLLYFNNEEESNPILSKDLEQWNEANFHTKIFNSVDFCNWISHVSRNAKNEMTINERTYLKRVGFLSKKSITRIQNSRKLVIHNHLEHNYFIGNKKALFYHMKKLYKLKGENIFDALPVTFHVSKGIEDPEYKNFIAYYNQLEERKKRGDQKNIWILKPGQFSNRGNGITVCHSLDDILIRLKSKEKSNDGNLRTFILQKYIEKPLLYKNRKFDIRHYLLLTCFNGMIKAYWYPEGYIRTASAVFSLKRGTNMFVHLTNDAIQQHSDEYGKYQKGNKISYQRFQSYLDKTLKQRQQKNLFYGKILPEMKQLCVNAVKATYLSLDQKRKQHNFELLGMDFMIDNDLKPWLIQINTNPCLELSCPLLSKIIPTLVQNTFQICVDPFFPPPEEWPATKKNFINDNALEENRFELIFDESTEGKEVQRLFKGDYMLANSIGKIQQDADVYENDGVEQWQGETLNRTDEF